MTVTPYAWPAADGHPSTGALAGPAAERLSRFPRQEVALDGEGPTGTRRRAGRGGGPRGVAGAVGPARLIIPAGATAALTPALPVGAAPTVAAVSLAVARLPAAAGGSPPRHAAPSAPGETLGSVRANVDVIRERAHR